jgi:hypothetical protein
MESKKLTISIFLLINLVLIQCGIPQEFADFRGLSDKEKHEKFKKLPLNKQVDFYLVMMSFHPPDLSYAFDIAGEGEVVIAYLIERLDLEQEDYRKADIIYIFEAMQVKGIDLRKRKDILLALSRIVNRMNDSPQKKKAENSLRVVEGQE